MSLARLWIAQNRADDARRRLSDLYAWFTEGFETPDLQAAGSSSRNCSLSAHALLT